jgi:hypothetical protein
LRSQAIKELEMEKLRMQKWNNKDLVADPYLKDYIDNLDTLLN